MNIAATIRQVQVALGVTADGLAGPETWTAIATRLRQAANAASGNSNPPAPATPSPASSATPAAVNDDKVDYRSEGNIATLHPKVQPYARALIHALTDRGIIARVIGGTRTYAQQTALYDQGRSEPGHVVTNAPAGWSNHNFGIAFDIGIWHAGDYLDDSPLYKVAGEIGRSIGLAWGGDWHRFADEPHFELHPTWAAGMSETEMLEVLRDRHSRGLDAFA